MVQLVIQLTSKAGLGIRAIGATTGAEKVSDACLGAEVGVKTGLGGVAGTGAGGGGGSGAAGGANLVACGIATD